ncbi:MAG: hypothetical protein JSV80_11670, partial [Acidobacteriota bacterium]
APRADLRQTRRIDVWRQLARLAELTDDAHGLAPADAVERIVSARDRDELPAADLALVAALMATGVLVPDPDGRLRAEDPVRVGELLDWVSRIGDRYELLPLQSGVVRGGGSGKLMLRTGRTERAWRVDEPPPDLLAETAGRWHARERIG